MFKRLTLWKRVLGGVARPTLMNGIYVSEWAGEGRWEGGRARLRPCFLAFKQRAIIDWNEAGIATGSQPISSIIHANTEVPLPHPAVPTPSAPLLNDIQSKGECRYF